MKRSKKSRALKRRLDAALSTIRDAEQYVGRGGAEMHARDRLAKALRRARRTVRDFKEELGEKDKEIMYLKRREQATRAFNGIHARRGPDPDHRWAVEKRLDYIINTPKLLKKTTGCTRGQFAEILKDFERDVLARGPLFRGDRSSAGDRGNRCKLYPRHVLLLALCRYYTGLTEDALGTWFGVDQSTVSRYLDLAAYILTDIVVSPKFLTELIKTIGDVDDLKQLIPHLRLLVDGTHIQRERPGDGAQRKAAYSGKKKRFTHNVQVITNCVGLILNLSGAAKGSTHDYDLFKKHLAGEGGRWLLELAERCEAMGEKLKLVVGPGIYWRKEGLSAVQARAARHAQVQEQQAIRPENRLADQGREGAQQGRFKDTDSGGMGHVVHEAVPVVEARLHRNGPGPGAGHERDSRAGQHEHALGPRKRRARPAAGQTPARQKAQSAARRHVRLTNGRHAAARSLGQNCATGRLRTALLFLAVFGMV